VTDLSALVGKTVVSAFEDEELVLVFADGAALVVGTYPSEYSSLTIDYNDGACHHDTGPLCLMGS
jgi:hypothetical protein